MSRVFLFTLFGAYIVYTGTAPEHNPWDMVYRAQQYTVGAITTLIALILLEPIVKAIAIEHKERADTRSSRYIH